MTTLAAEFAHATTLPWEIIGVRLLLAATLGAVVGIEREWLERPAGLRTHILVSLAAAAMAVITVELVHLPAFDEGAAEVDPVRLVEAITSGVAFLAAGMIVFNRGEVRGLTTGAGLWLAAAIGLAAGLGLWSIAALATVMGVTTLWLLRHLQNRFHLNRNDSHDAGSRDSGRVSSE